MLRIDAEVQLKQGLINLIVGPTGSGKTSFLMALLGASECSSPPWQRSSSELRRDALYPVWTRLVLPPSPDWRCCVCSTGVMGTE